jgi:hypothetical protein
LFLKNRISLIFALVFLITAGVATAKDISFTQEDRDRLIRLETTMRDFKDSTDRRFTELREDMNKRFEQVDKRFEQVDKRFEQMFTFLWILTGIFTTLTLGNIGFAYWDRRTIIKKAKEEAIDEIEKEGRLGTLINALRELSKKDLELEKVLRQFHLL